MDYNLFFLYYYKCFSSVEEIDTKGIGMYGHHIEYVSPYCRWFLFAKKKHNRCKMYKTVHFLQSQIGSQSQYRLLWYPTMQIQSPNKHVSRWWRWDLEWYRRISRTYDYETGQRQRQCYYTLANVGETAKLGTHGLHHCSEHGLQRYASYCVARIYSISCKLCLCFCFCSYIIISLWRYATH